MPELPEVETVRRGLADRLVNFQIERIDVCRPTCIASPGGPKEFITKLQGALVGDWERRGKYLLSRLLKKSDLSTNCSTEFADGGLWGIHLRMTGHFQLFDEPNEPCSHTRVRIWSYQGQELRFIDTRSFGQMWWVPPGITAEKIIKGLKTLGPEPFSKSFNASYLSDRLKNSKRAIKSSLLDQSVVAGAGNIYSDESLFSAGILPHTQSKDLNYNQLKKLCQSLVDVLKISIGKGGTSFSDFRDLKGLNGNYGGQAWVYQRSGKPCRVCGTQIQKEVISGRSSHWCPKCQT